MTSRFAALRGGLFALAAAVLFGISTALVQRAGDSVGAFTSACVLYLGAADDLKASRAWQAVQQAKEAWPDRLPEHQSEWFGCLIGLPRAELIVPRVPRPDSFVALRTLTNRSSTTIALESRCCHRRATQSIG